MLPRFYVPDAVAPGQRVDLLPAEAEHLARVLRLDAGDAIRVFNGRGGEFDAVVAEVTRSRVGVRVGEPRTAAPEPLVAITLAPAVLKGDKMDDVVRDAVMIGAVAIQPLITGRTEVSRGALEHSRRIERWERIAVSSAKQCGRSLVPPILPPRDVASLAAGLADLTVPAPGLAFVEPAAASDALRLADLDPAPPREATVIAGPEGGWTPQEIEILSAACRLVTLRGPTLRADAMPLVALSALCAHWRAF